jgi:hypothetical protein
MPTQDERNRVAIEVARIKGFLDFNQLVQAHGISQKIEDMIRDVMLKESQDSKIEDHEWWETLRRARKLKEQLFKGNPNQEGHEMLSELGASI